MADATLPEDLPVRHPNAGRKQSAEHIAKRVAATARTKVEEWSAEKNATFRARVSANTAARRPDVRKRNSDAQLATYRNGRVAWNKGNRWQDNFSPEEVRAIGAKRARDRRAKSPKRKLHERITARVRQSLRGDKYRRSWEDLVGYSLDDLQKRLARTMPPGYGWADLGRLHIDHIIPVSAFNFATAEDIDFRRCWALSNLQLLPASENLEKKATLKRPFQPSLSLHPSGK